MSLRLVVWTPNYAPELIGIAPLVTDACSWLAARDHRVHVATAFPNYPERRIRPEFRRRLTTLELRDGVAVRRTWLRVRPGESIVDKLMYETTFAAASAPVVARHVRDADVLLCLVPSLAAAAAARPLARLLRCRVPTVLWMQDLVLQAAHTLMSPGPAAARALRLAEVVEAAALRHADRVVVCSPAFAQHVENAGVDPNRVDLLYNWADIGRFPVVAEPPAPPVRFLYAGNLGYSQNVETLVEAARRLPGGIEVEIVGAGNAAAEVRASAADVPLIRVGDPVPEDAYPALLASAHVHVVIQGAEIADANFPSKIASYLASGRPVVASISPRSAAAAALAESKAAVLVPPGEPAALAAAMTRLASDAELRAQLGTSARAYATRRFERRAALQRLEQILLETAARGGRDASL